MSVVLSEHLPLLASAPDGIKKLRGLILELAVRGKLVPQDPSDEPSSELLKRIAAEKARLAAEGTCKKPKANPLDDAESLIFNIAPGWESAPLGDVVDIIRGITFPSSEKSKAPEAGRIRCLRTSNVQDKIEWGDILYIRSEFVSRNDQALCPNDIVMSMANSRELVGKVALVENQLTEPATFGGFLGVLRPHLILPRFVMAFLRAPTVRSSLIDSASQTTNIANISLAKLRPLSFPIPPLPEQHRIVVKVDELMALCDRMEAEQADAEAAHATLVQTLLGTLTQSRDAAELAANWQRLNQHFDTLFTTEKSLDSLKQTILQLAVMGRLVPQDPTDEPASELLKRIAAEKAKLITEGKIRGKATVSPLKNGDEPFLVPSNWAWAPFGEIMISRDGERIPVSRDERNGREKIYDYYGASGVIDKIDSYLFDKPLLLVGEDGANLINRSTPIAFIARGKYWVNNHAHVLDGITEDFLRFIELHINAIDLRPYVTGTAQPKMNQAKMNSIPIALPPLAEQHRIVAKVDELMALCDSLKADLADSRARQARLATTLIEFALQAA